MMKLDRIHLYATPPQPCSYLKQEESTTLFVDPDAPKDMRLYERLSEHGFRRSGKHIYRPYCKNCHACISVRLPVSQFLPTRSQKRVIKRNRDIDVIKVAAEFNEEHFDLYNRYQQSRHKDGGMDKTSRTEYEEFLITDWCDTVFYEFRLQEQLVAVATADISASSFAAMYTFFDPEFKKRSLGSYAILWEIEETKRLGLNWLYLGYWIRECQKMNYKTNYQPLEYYQYGIWSPLSPS